MTWNVSGSGTASLTVGTENTLKTDTSNGTYYFEVDASAIAAGDVLELRIYVTTLNGGASRVAWMTSVGPSPPSAPILASPPQPSDQSISVSAKQVAGTARSIPWKLLRI